MARQCRWFAALVLAGILVAGCKNGDGTGVDDNVVLANDDAADAIAFSLSGSQSSGGLTAQLEESTALAGAGLMSKTDILGNAQWDTTVTRTHAGLSSYAYTFHFTMSLVSGSRLDFGYAMKGTYDVPRMSSNDSATAAFQVSNLLTGSAYVVNGTYTRYGSQTSKVRAKNTWSSVITVTMTALSVEKTSMKINSGSANISMVGKTGAGISYSLSGKLTFLGTDRAILVIGSNTYTIDLSTGEATLAG